MENPATWGETQHAIQSALNHAQEAKNKGLIGYSTATMIFLHLKSEGLLDKTAPALEQWLEDFNCSHPPRVGGWCDDCDRDVVKPLEALLETSTSEKVSEQG